ncbi:MAG: cobalamin-binding protein [Dehalococcoidia bacterium]|nr:MAG: cobalamin-binding protein [Dehalococcoidia bacterium]
MKTLNILLISLVLIIAFVTAFTGCANNTKTITIKETKTMTATIKETIIPIDITDDLGRQVTIGGVPSRIVSLAPSNTEIIYALGLEDKLVGVTQFCNYPAAAMTKEKVGGFDDVDIEKVVALNPDLILAEDIHKHAVIPALEQRGFSIIALVPHNFQEVMESILLIGRVTGAEDKALEIVNDMDNKIKAITNETVKLTEREKPKVLYIIWHEPMMSVGNDTRIHELIEKAGGINIAAIAGEGYPTLTLEEIISINPQVIIVNKEEYEGGDISLQFVLNESRLATVDASRNGQIYGIKADLTNRPTPRLVQALEAMAKMIHPEVFGSIQ